MTVELIRIKDLVIEVRRSPRRKSVELTVERDGHIAILAPDKATSDSLRSLATEKLVWIYQQLGRKDEELRGHPDKEYVSGEGFFHLGRKYRLLLVDNGESLRVKGALQLRNGRFVMPRHLADRGRELFIRWYADKAREWVSRRIEILKDRVGINEVTVDIRDLSFRWGSCTSGGKLYFHWRIILLPPAKIDYLILHELVHLHEHNHSPAFYERLRRAAPDYEQQEEWLRRNGDAYAL